MRDGGELSDHLRQLSDSLRTNAERLLRDIRLAHGTLTARLDQVDTGTPEVRAARTSSSAARSGRSPTEPPPDGDFSIPEFIPRR